MCTSILYKNGSISYFGRNLDLQYAMGTKVTVAPRNMPLKFRNGEVIENHPAMVGMAIAPDEKFPLFFEAFNEYGVGIAQLHFQNMAVYQKEVKEGNIGLASFEMISYLLAKCRSVAELKEELKHITVLDTAFSEQFPPAPLHWMMADKDQSIVVEPLEQGLSVHDDIVNVMTNCPEYPAQYFNFCNYMGVTGKYPTNRIAPQLDLACYSTAMGSFGLPGGVDSASRFVRAGFTLNNSIAKETDEDTMTQCFHIMESVAQSNGTNQTEDKLYEITQYTVACNLGTMDFYWTTYHNNQINGLHTKKLDLDANTLYEFEVSEKQAVHFVE